MRSSSKKGIPKRRGRPATGKDPLISARVPVDVVASIEAWSAAKGVTRSEAIRRLVELGLTVGTKTSPSQRLRAAHADRAKDLATKAIEKIIDPAAPPEERAQRRRRLTKGPTEFRENRVDLPKAKSK
jgi:hypothetical protein